MSVGFLANWLNFYLGPAVASAIAGLISTLSRMLYSIGSILFILLDFVQDIFRRILGLTPGASIDGVPVESNDILSYILNSEMVISAFTSLILVGILLLFLFTIIQFIRIEHTSEGDKNTRSNIVSESLKALTMFLIVPIACGIGIFLSNQLLQILDSATSGGGETQTISGLLFKVSAFSANPIRSGESKALNAGVSIHDTAMNFQAYQFYKGEDSWDFKLNITTPALLRKTFTVRREDHHIVASFIKAQVEYVGEDSDGNAQYKFLEDQMSWGNTGLTNEYVTTGLHSDLSGLIGEQLANKLDELFALRSTVAAADNGSFFTSTIIKENHSLNYTNTKAVSYFYNLEDFNYFLLFLCGWFALKSLLFACFGLIMRLYMVTMLFIISPPIIAMAPIDKGRAFGNWRGKFIGQVISAYGIVVGLNLFFKIAGVLQTVEIFTTDKVGFSALPATWFNSLFQTLVILVGCLMIKNFSKVIGDLIGAADVTESGSAMASDVGKTAGRVVGAAAIGGALVVGGGTALAGRMAAYAGTGRERRVDKADANVAKAESKLSAARSQAISDHGGLSAQVYDNLTPSEKKFVDGTFNVQKRTNELRSRRTKQTHAIHELNASPPSRAERTLSGAGEWLHDKGERTLSRSTGLIVPKLKKTTAVKSFNDFTGNSFTAAGGKAADATTQRRHARLGGRVGSDSVTRVRERRHQEDVAGQVGTQYATNIAQTVTAQRAQIQVSRDDLSDLFKQLQVARDTGNVTAENNAIENMNRVEQKLRRDGVLTDDNQGKLSSQIEGLSHGASVGDVEAYLTSENVFETRIEAMLSNPELTNEINQLRDAVDTNNVGKINEHIQSLESQFAAANIGMSSLKDITDTITKSINAQKSNDEILKKLGEMVGKK